MKTSKAKAPDRIILFEIGVILSLLAINYILNLEYTNTFKYDQPMFDTTDRFVILVAPSEPVKHEETRTEVKHEVAVLFDPRQLIKQVNDLFKIKEPVKSSALKLPGKIEMLTNYMRPDTSIILDGKADVMPHFPGGQEALQKYIERNYSIPIFIMDYTSEVEMEIEFIIDRQGNVTNVQVVKCNYPGMGAEPEAIRVYSRMPKWDPAIYRGYPASIRLTQPFKIRID